MTTDEVNQIIWAAQDRAMQFDLAIKKLSEITAAIWAYDAEHGVSE